MKYNVELLPLKLDVGRYGNIRSFNFVLISSGAAISPTAVETFIINVPVASFMKIIKIYQDKIVGTATQTHLSGKLVYNG